MTRDMIIKQVADAVGSPHSVDLKKYDLLVLVEIYQVRFWKDEYSTVQYSTLHADIFADAGAVRAVQYRRSVLHCFSAFQYVYASGRVVQGVWEKRAGRLTDLRLTGTSWHSRTCVEWPW